MLAALALVWGASFLFIKVAVRELAPSTLILGRLGLAALMLATVAVLTSGARATVAEVRANAGWLVVAAILNTALPFWLLSWGETRIDSGLASILQAAVPLFTALVAFGFFREARVTGLRLLGVALGFFGVALLVGAQPEGKLLAAVAVVGMALCYAVAGLLIGRHLRHVRPLVVALATTAVSALVTLPAGVVQAPAHVPGWKTVASVVMLAGPGTAFAYLLFFALLRGPGASYASLVTYLVPPLALAYGAIFLDEHFGAAAFGGLVLILGGVALGTGAVGARRLRRAVASQPS
jgi:drug/metabolite transporter (DMT)-like permease